MAKRQDNDLIITVQLQGDSKGLDQSFAMSQKSAQNLGAALSSAFAKPLNDSINRLNDTLSLLAKNLDRVKTSASSIKSGLTSPSSIQSEIINLKKLADGSYNVIRAKEELSAKERQLEGARRGREAQIRQQQARDEAKQRQIDGAAKGRAVQRLQHEIETSRKSVEISKRYTDALVQEAERRLKALGPKIAQQAAAVEKVTAPQPRNAFSSANINSPYTTLTGANVLKGIGAGAVAGGKELVNQFREVGGNAVKAFQGKFSQISTAVAAEATKARSRFGQIFAANFFAGIAYNAVASFLHQLNNVTIQTVKYAARTQELGVVLTSLARQNNLSTESVKEQEVAIKSLNITTQDARESLARFINVGFDINKAGPLARVAQDLAVISGVSSSEELNKLIVGIQTLQSRNLRTAGVYITVDEVLDRLAGTTGRARDSFSTLEKQQAVLNAVMEYGTKVAGSYEAAMTTASKQMRSLERQAYEAQNSLGEAFIPAMGTVISLSGSFLETVAKYPNIFLGAAEVIGVLTVSLIALRTQAIQGAVSGLASLGASANDTLLALRGKATSTDLKNLSLKDELNTERNILVAKEAKLSAQIQEIEKQVVLNTAKKEELLLERNVLAAQRTQTATKISSKDAAIAAVGVQSAGDKIAGVVGKIAVIGAIALTLYEVAKGIYEINTAAKDFKSLDTNIANKYREELENVKKLKKDYSEIQDVSLEGISAESQKVELAKKLDFHGKSYLNTLNKQKEASGDISKALDYQQRVVEDKIKGQFAVAEFNVVAAYQNLSRTKGATDQSSARIRELEAVIEKGKLAGAPLFKPDEVEKNRGFFRTYSNLKEDRRPSLDADYYNSLRDAQIELIETQELLGVSTGKISEEQDKAKQKVQELLNLSSAYGRDFNTSIDSIINKLGEEGVAVEDLKAQYLELLAAQQKTYLENANLRTQNAEELLKGLYGQLTKGEGKALQDENNRILQEIRVLQSRGDITGLQKYTDENFLRSRYDIAKDSYTKNFFKDEEKELFYSGIQKQITDEEKTAGRTFSELEKVQRTFQIIEDFKQRVPGFEPLFNLIGDKNERDETLKTVKEVVDKIRGLTEEAERSAAVNLGALFNLSAEDRKRLFIAEDTEQQASSVKRIQRLRYDLYGKTDFDPKTADTPQKAEAVLKSLENQKKIHDGILNARIRLKELQDGPNKQLESLERQIKVEEAIYKFKNQQKDIEDEIAVLKVTSTLPAINSELLAQKAILELVVERKQAEQQLTADIAVEINKRKTIGLDANRLVAETFLEQMRGENAAESDAFKSLLQLRIQEGDTSIFENNPLVQEAVAQSEKLEDINKKGGLQVVKIDETNKILNITQGINTQMNQNLVQLGYTTQQGFNTLGPQIAAIMAQQIAATQMNPMYSGGSTTGQSLPSLSKDEDLAIRMIIAESKGQGTVGMQAVAAVIRNRAVRSGKTLSEVVTATDSKGSVQFEPWKTRRAELLGYNLNSPELAQIANSVLPNLRGQAPDPTGGATHFWSPSAQRQFGRRPPSWGNRNPIKIGDHIFNRIGYSGKGRHGFSDTVVSNVQNQQVETAILDKEKLLKSFKNLTPEEYEAIISNYQAYNYKTKSLGPIPTTVSKPMYDALSNQLAKADVMKEAFGNIEGSNVLDISKTNQFKAAKQYTDDRTKRLEAVDISEATRAIREYNKEKIIELETREAWEKYRDELGDEALFGSARRTTEATIALERLNQLREKGSVWFNQVYGEASLKRIQDSISLEKELIGLQEERQYRTENFGEYLLNQSKLFNKDQEVERNNLEDQETQLQLRIRASRDATSQYTMNLVRREMLARNEARLAVEEELKALGRYTKEYLGTAQQRLDFEKQALAERKKAHNDTVDAIIKLEIETANIREGLEERLALKQAQINRDRAGEFEANLGRQLELENQLQRKFNDEVNPTEVRNAALEKLVGEVKSKTELMQGLWLDSFDAISGGFASQIDKMTDKLGIFGGVIGNFLKGMFNRTFGQIFNNILDGAFPQDQKVADAKNYQAGINGDTAEAEYLKTMAVASADTMNTAATGVVNSANNLILGTNGAATASANLANAFTSAANSILSVAGILQERVIAVSNVGLGGGGGGIAGLGGLISSGQQQISTAGVSTGNFTLGTPELRPLIPYITASQTVSGSGGAGSVLGGLAASGVTGILGGTRVGGVVSGQAGNAISSLLKGVSLKSIGKSFAQAAPLLGAGLGGLLGGGSQIGSLLGQAGGLIGGAGIAGVLGFGPLASGGALAGIGSAISGIGSSLFGASGVAATALGATVVLAPIAAALLIGAKLFSNAKKRKADEKVRVQAQNDAITQLKDILKQVQTDKIDGDEGIARAMAIREEYLKVANGLKTKNARKWALADVVNLDTIISQIKSAANQQTRRRETDLSIVPTYASGGVANTSFIRVSKGERLYHPDTVGVMRDAFAQAGIPGLSSVSSGKGSNYGVVQIGGRFDAKDNIYVEVPKGTVIANPSHQRVIDGGGYASGGVYGTVVAHAAQAATVQTSPVTVIVVMSDEEAAKLGGMIPNSTIVGKVRHHIKKTGKAGLVGDIFNEASR